MSDQSVDVAVQKLVQALFQISPGRLRPGADGHGFAVVKVGGRTDLVDVRADVVAASHHEAHAVRTLVVTLDAQLHFVTQIGNQSTEPERRVVVESRVQTLGSHPTTQAFGVSGQSGDGHAQVAVQGRDFLLVSGQLRRSSFQSHENGVRLALEAHGGRALLDGLHGVFHLMEAALRRPSGHVAIVLVPELRIGTNVGNRAEFKDLKGLPCC